MKDGSPLTIQGVRQILNHIEHGTGGTADEAVVDFFHKASIGIAVLMYFYEQSLNYVPLYGEVVHSALYEDGHPLNVRQREDGMWEARAKSSLNLPVDDAAYQDALIERNYFPVVTSASDLATVGTLPTTKSLAAMLAMKSVMMFLPEVGLLNPEEVLAARQKLSDNLAHFWATMLRLSQRLKEEPKTATQERDMLSEAQELVDAEVLPAVLELRKQMELERKILFLRVLEPIRAIVKLVVGTALLNPRALTIASLDASRAMSQVALGHLESLSKDEKKRALAFLLELPKVGTPKETVGIERFVVEW